MWSMTLEENEPIVLKIDIENETVCSKVMKILYVVGGYLIRI